MAIIVSLRSLFLAAIAGLCLERAHTYYVPESAPRNYRKGERVELKFNKLTSTRTLVPMDPYRLGFCLPEEGVRMGSMNLGEFLEGDRVTSSPYSIMMLQDMYCKQLCVAHLGRLDAPGVSPNKISKAIRDGYRQNWMLDGLPAAMKHENEDTIRTRFWGGLPIGFVGPYGKAYVNNHVNIEISYHPYEGDIDAYRVVRFVVQPFSIRHEFELPKEGQSFLPQIANITNPIKSCDHKSFQSPYHTSYEMVNEYGRDPLQRAQPASGIVLYTYDVIWIEDTNLPWANRWEIYLSMDTGVPDVVHWYSIENSVVIAVILLTAILLAPIRHLRREISRFKSGGSDQQGYGWTLLHGDVFRPPTFCPNWLAIAAGAGAHLLATMLVTCSFCSSGYLSFARRGSLIMGPIMIYAVLGCVGGYVTVFFCRIFGCKNMNRVKWVAALGFPGLLFGILVLMSVMAYFKSSTAAIPLLSIVVLATTWLFVLVPSCLGGAWLCLRRSTLSFPVAVNPEPREIPRRPCLLTFRVMTVIAGITGVNVVYVENFYLMASVWLNFYYVGFAYFLLALILLMLITAEMTVLGTYVQLNRQDHQWWWRSFYTGGATAFFLFGYSWYFFRLTEIHTLWAVFVYTCSMALICFSVFLALGFVGLTASLLFTRFLYDSIPWSIDLEVVEEPSPPEVELKERNNSVGVPSGSFGSAGTRSRQEDERTSQTNDTAFAVADEAGSVSLRVI